MRMRTTVVVWTSIAIVFGDCQAILLGWQKWGKRSWGMSRGRKGR